VETAFKCTLPLLRSENASLLYESISQPDNTHLPACTRNTSDALTASSAARYRKREEAWKRKGDDSKGSCAL